MKKKNIYGLIPFGIASILVLTHLMQTLLKLGYVNADGNEVTYVVTDSVMFGGVGLLVVLTLILLNRRVWKYVFAILVILAFTPWFSFYNHTFSFGIGMFSLEVTALSLLIFHLIVNQDIFQSFKSFIKPQLGSDESKKLKFESSVIGFERRFSKKSTDELRNIVEQSSLVPGAIEAARRLLERR